MLEVKTLDRSKIGTSQIIIVKSTLTDYPTGFSIPDFKITVEFVVAPSLTAFEGTRGNLSPEFVKPLQAIIQVDISERNQSKLIVGTLADYEGDFFTVAFSGDEALNFLWPSYDDESGDIYFDFDLTEIEDWRSLLGTYTVTIIITEPDDEIQ